MNVAWRWCSVLLVLLLAPLAQATIYYSSPSGGGDCLTAETPCRLQAGFAKLHSGDTLQLRGGTYAEQIINPPIPAGTSWSRVTTIMSYPGEVAVIKPNSGGTVMGLTPAPNRPYRFISFDRLVFDGANAGFNISIQGDDPVLLNHLRFQDGEVRNAPLVGFSGLGDDAQVLRMKIHHNGIMHLSHNFYVCSKRMVIAHNDIYGSKGYGIQVFKGDGCADGTLIYNNRIHHNGGSDCNGWAPVQCGAAAGVIFGSGSSIQFVNNYVYANEGGGLKPVGYGGANRNIIIERNTIVGNAGAAIAIRPDVSGAKVSKNILSGNAGGIEDSGVGTILDDNFLGDPQFVNPEEYDFRLQPGSPATGHGAVPRSGLPLIDLAPPLPAPLHLRVVSP